MALRSSEELLVQQKMREVYASRLTSALDGFIDTRLLSAAVHVGIGDESQFTAARGVTAKVSAAVHSPLERVAVPSKDIVGVLSETSPTIC